MNNMTTKRYRKRPVEIDAVQWTGSAERATPIINWIIRNGGTARYHSAEPPRMHSMHCRCDGRGIVPGPHGKALMCPETEPMGPIAAESIHIDTLEGTMRAIANDFIIKGIQNEFYPCKPDIFADTYEEVDVPLANDKLAGKCICGHYKIDHIYYEFACRPAGIICGCKDYEVVY